MNPRISVVIVAVIVAIQSGEVSWPLLGQAVARLKVEREP